MRYERLLDLLTRLLFDLESEIDNKLLASYIILMVQSSMVLSLRNLENSCKNS